MGEQQHAGCDGDGEPQLTQGPAKNGNGEMGAKIGRDGQTVTGMSYKPLE